ncbi:MAG: aspartyl protease family protein [Saprospiraceae bacterium]|nr:aspartyl protease family protein [Saprospiraceae bacterium]
MKRYFLFLFLFGISTGIFGQKPKIDAKNFVEEIPYEFVNGRIIVPVQINGHDYRFFLNTGGTFVVSTALQEKLQPKKVGMSRVMGVNDIPMDMQVVRIDELKLGEVAFKNFRALVLPNPYPMACFDVDGIIGKDFLYELTLHFDHAAKQITFTDDFDLLNKEVGNSQEITYDYITGLPSVNIKINENIEGSVVFDTGSDHLISLQREVLEKLREKNKIKRDNIYRIYGSIDTGLTGRLAPAANNYYIYVDEMQLAGSTLTDFVTDVSKESDSRMGTGMIKNGLVTIDYKQRRFYFKPTVTSTDYKVSIPPYGFVVRSKEAEFFVSATLAGSNAKKAGLRVDDRLISINGYDYTDFTVIDRCDAYLNGYPWEKDRKIKMVVMRAGREMTFEFTVGVSN